mmetsp:Transcript_16918/g.26036  ORF Transcript_16918/g.26036 Transcript_16918/m.26036 type:complete len:176 (-) Transcript_16918:629-1156(-)
MEQPWNIHLKDESEFKDKIQKMREDGADNLMIMSDFDYTISKYLYPLDFLEAEKRKEMEAAGKDRKMCMASMQAMLRAPSMTQECEDHLWELFDKYGPIEKQLSMPKAEKAKHMRNWTETNMSDFSKLGLHSSEFHQIIKNADIALRWGVLDFFAALRDTIPIFFVSGGIKPVVD